VQAYTVTCAEADELRRDVNGRCAPGIRGQRTSGFGRQTPLVRRATQAVIAAGSTRALSIGNRALGSVAEAYFCQLYRRSR
jgi:hypothetical protein